MAGRRAPRGRDHQNRATPRWAVVVVAALFAAAAIALGLVPAATRAASPPDGGSPPFVVSSDTHHDTSRPLHSYKPTGTQGTMHPVKHGNPNSAGPPAADTSGGPLAATANAPAATNNFDGTPDNSGLVPPDPNGAVGTTQFVEVVNSQIAVYNKSGTKLLGPENTNTLFSGFGGTCQTSNDGDATVQFDTISQRWVVQQLQVSSQPFDICVAVSTGADATGSWNRYSFSYGSTFPDYPKLGVWPDAYYLTVNRFNASGTLGLGEETCALNRAAMLTGAAASTQCFSLNSSGENTALPASLNGTTPPAAGTPEWLVGISPTTSNALAYWRLHIDWTTPANSSLSAQTDLPVTAFSEACSGFGTCVPQSGTTQQLDSLGDRLMNSLPYRNFGDHESILATHSISAGSSVGMRWYELRPSGSTLGVFQQGTYAPDSTYRWMGSINMDQSGDAALGYNTSSSTLHPGIAYTGRLASDPAGTMPQGETTLFTGAGSQTGGNAANRWGDYSGMSVDPSDGCTFWYVDEYIPSNGNFNWHTRIGSFKFPSCGGTPTNDFSISASPSSLTLAQNASGSSTISTALTSGTAGTVSLGVSGAPAGATATLGAASVTAGGSTGLSVGAGTATPGSYTLTVTGTEGTVTHSAVVALTVTGVGGAVVTNGGFETGSLSSWSTGGVFSPTATTTQKHSGAFAAQLSASAEPEPNGDSSLTQTITVPSGASTLSFWYWPSSTDTITYDWQEAQIRNTSGATLASVFKVCSNAQAWTQVTFNMTPYAGQNVQLWFNAHGDGYGDLTYMYLDDVSVTQNAPPPNDFSISAGAFSPASVVQGGSASSTISTTVTSGSTQSVALTATGLPSGATASFNPTPVNAGQGSTLTVATTASTPAGNYTITVTGTGSAAVHSTTAALSVVAPNDFSIGAGSFSPSPVTQGGSANSTITTAVTSGSTQSVALTATGLPSGATASFNPTPVNAGQGSTLTVATATNTPTGNYTITVTGTAPSGIHSTTAALSVVAPGDFSISANPTSLTLAQNAAGSSSISTAVTSGAAGTVSLTVSGAPSGATATMTPASVTAGGTSALNVNARTAAPGSYTLTVTGTEGTATHSAVVALTVTGVGGAVVTNGGFETGSLSSWSTGGVFSPTVTTTQKHSGAFAAQLSASAEPEPNGDSSLTQTITVPSGASTLSFWYWPSSTDTITYDWQEAQIRNTSGATLASVFKVCSNAQAWTQVTFNMTPYAGQNVQLWFNAHGDGYGDLTYMYLDDVSVTQNAPPPNDFSISASPTSLTLAPNAAGSSSITTAVTSGSAGTVSLGVSGAPSGATATLTPPSVTAGGTSALNVNAGTAAPGSYTLTVTGTEGSSQHSTTVSLTVTGSGPPPGLMQLSSDSFTDPNAEHATQVEPDTLSNGSTLVSVFQDGRFNNGGADAIGFATTTNGGSTWTQGLLPGLTTVQGGSNLGWARVSDPAIAYDPRHGLWIAESLTLDSNVNGRGVAINTSTDGVTWSAATNAISQSADSFDKSWIACDRTSTSSHYGNCYIEFDDNTQGNLMRMLTSTDGGATWSVPRSTSDSAHGLGGQPLVQPNGTVVVPYFADSASQMRSFTSTNGGNSWNSSSLISSVTDSAPAGGFRSQPLPSAEIDSSGIVYLVWQDCRFRSGCTSNDLVMSKSSTSGSSWGSVTRIPIDSTSSGADHFLPGIAVDRSTSGSSAHLGLYYYYYPVAACTTCQLDVGFISSANGGSSWSTATQVAGPMTLNELAPTTDGPMAGDYISASFMAGRAWAVFPLGLPPSGGTLNEAMYTLSGGLAAPGGTHQPGTGVGGGQGGGRGHSKTAY
ncbi:MAG: exo-alpha-sialidase [Candidatus Dormibacteria bacterium]